MIQGKELQERSDMCLQHAKLHASELCLTAYEQKNVEETRQDATHL